METFSFNTDDVENKLYDIMAAFQALSFAVNGLKNFDQITDDELSGFEYIIRDGILKSNKLIKGMKIIKVKR